MSNAPRWAIEGRGWPLAAHSQFVEAGGLRWHVQLLGEGPPLLLIHGTGAATHSWRDLAPLLARHFTVVQFDLPGHGFTTGKPLGGFSLPSIARSIGDLLQALQVTPQLVMGHSAGAAIAAEMTISQLVVPAGVIGIGAALRPFPGLAGRLFPSLARLLFLNPLVPHICARIARIPGETARFLERSTGSRIDAAGADLYGRLFGRADHCAGAIALMADWQLGPLAESLGRLGAPLLLIHGDADAAIPVSAAQATAAAISGSRLEIVKGLGHLAHEEQPAQIAAIVLEFATAIGLTQSAAAQ